MSLYPAAAKYFAGEANYRLLLISFDQDGFIGRDLSASYAPEEGTAAYDAYIDELGRLFGKYSINGRLCLPNITESYVGEV